MKTEDVLMELSIEEKSRLLTGVGEWSTYGIEKYGIRSAMCSDGSHGLKLDYEDNCTLFPALCNLSSSWNKDAARAMGRAIADECIKNNINIILGPGVNIKRHILCGRNFEYLSEDPVLAGEIAAAYVEGIQEKGVSACVKHYAVNNQEADRQFISVEIDERSLREIYLKVFEIIVKKAKPDSIMCAYNKVNGIWCSENEFLLKEILKNEWGYDGLVISDWGAVIDSVKSLKAGIDLQMPEISDIAESIKKGIETGEISIADLDEAVANIIEFSKKKRAVTADFNRDKHHEISKSIASDGIVLLKNDDETLPVTSEKYKKIAVVGEYAVSPLINGRGSVEVMVNERYLDLPLAELKKRISDIEFKYLEMYDKNQITKGSIVEFNNEIEDCDAVLFFMGSVLSDDKEGFDRRSAFAYESQLQFIKYAMIQGKKIIIVMQNGGALIPDKWVSRSDAIIEMWLGGEAAGSAIADVLCGRVNPSGKLSETFPNTMRKDLEYPGNGKFVEYKERFDVGYRYYDKHPEEIWYPFGHGLSYTKFEYKDLCVNEKELSFKFTLKNTGKCDGAEVCQLYVGDCESTVLRPVKELKRFEKIFLRAGEEKQVKFELTPEDFAYYNVSLHRWVAENGKYDIYIGASSRDIKFKVRVDYNADMPYSLIHTLEKQTGKNIFK